MRTNQHISRKKGERGIVIVMVAVFLLFVVVAMAALAIDLVSFYTARSEAQLAADSAALAGARVLANSGATSGDPSNTTLIANAETLASTVAVQVAAQNKIGGKTPDPVSDVTVTFPPTPGGNLNQQVSVTVTRNDLPTFFARIWGQTQITVSATAAAEVYNSSGVGGALFSASPPVAPTCLKPWLLPNLDPNSPGTIFNPSSGAIQDYGLLGYDSMPITFACGTNDCSSFTPAPTTPWVYYPASQASLPPPPASQTRTSCSAGFNAYQLSIAGCVHTPIACGDGSVITSSIDIDQTAYPPNGANRNADTDAAINCLTHSAAGKGDTIDTAAVPPSPPFQFIAGADNPVPGVAGKDVFVSDSLVTIPVFDTNGWAPPTVKVIGFVQVFLNQDGNASGPPSSPSGSLRAKVINLVGCGTTATGQPVLGNGGTPVPVRLIKP